MRGGADGPFARFLVMHTQPRDARPLYMQHASAARRAPRPPKKEKKRVCGTTPESEKKSEHDEK